MRIEHKEEDDERLPSCVSSFPPSTHMEDTTTTVIERQPRLGKSPRKGPPARDSFSSVLHTCARISLPLSSSEASV